MNDYEAHAVASWTAEVAEAIRHEVAHAECRIGCVRRPKQKKWSVFFAFNADGWWISPAAAREFAESLKVASILMPFDTRNPREKEEKFERLAAAAAQALIVSADECDHRNAGGARRAPADVPLEFMPPRGHA